MTMLDVIAAASACFVGLVIANLTYQALGARNWRWALSVSYFQTLAIVALVVVLWLDR